MQKIYIVRLTEAEQQTLSLHNTRDAAAYSRAARQCNSCVLTLWLALIVSVSFP